MTRRQSEQQLIMRVYLSFLMVVAEDFGIEGGNPIGIEGAMLLFVGFPGFGLCIIPDFIEKPSAGATGVIEVDSPGGGIIETERAGELALGIGASDHRWHCGSPSGNRGRVFCPYGWCPSAAQFQIGHGERIFCVSGEGRMFGVGEPLTHFPGTE